MAQPQLVQQTYRAGMKRDGARESLPEGALWNLVNFLPEVLGAVCRKRGGWQYASQDFTAIKPTASFIRSGIVAEFTAGQSVLAMDVNGWVYEVESTTATESIGQATFGRQNLFYNNMAIFLGDGSGVVYKVTRAGATHTVAPLGGTPPLGKYGLVYKDVVWMGGEAALPKRTYFSKAGDAQVWDKTVKWLDMSYPVTGYAALSNAVLIFSLGRTARVRGSIPPPNGDLSVDDPVFEVGCTDNRSIANYRDKCIFANAQGLYMTDGVALEDLTRVCGMKSWWRDIMKGRDGFSSGSPYSTNWIISGGIYDDFYFYSITNGTAIVDSGMIDLTRYNWVRLTNIDAAYFFDRLYPQELYWGQRGVPRVATISDIFVPTVANVADADGDPVIPSLETLFFAAEPGMKTLQTLFLQYLMTGTAPPTLRVSFTLEPAGTVYTALVPDLPANGLNRTHLEINRPGLGIAFKVEQLGASTDTRLHTMSLAAQAREKSR